MWHHDLRAATRRRLARVFRARRRLRSPWDSDESIRAETFGAERLEECAANLAVAHRKAGVAPRRPPLARRLRDNEIALVDAHQRLSAAMGGDGVVSAAAEWLLDNFHLVEEQIREIRRDLPDGYYRQLPKLAAGLLGGYPRVLGFAWEFVAHTDSRFDPELLCRFTRAYQRVEPLTIGELWALAITLRIVLVENLRRSASRSVDAGDARAAADATADRLLGLKGQDDRLAGEFAGMQDSGELRGDFAAQLVQRLRDQDPHVTPALLRLEERLAAQGTNSTDIVHAEHQRQGAANVTVRNIITSMRLISEVDWAEIFESVSGVDVQLRAHAGFAQMDFATRNLYRSAIEDLARRSPLSEHEVTRRAMAATHGEAAGATPNAARRADPGWALIGPGRPALEASIGYRRRWGRCRTEPHDARARVLYLLAILLATAAVVALGLVALAPWLAGAGALALAAVLGLLPASDTAVALVNRVVAARVGPLVLPGLELREGVPPAFGTLVVMPVMLGSPALIAAHVERLEIHYLASPTGAVAFALLSDWLDASTEATDSDAALLAAATEGIARLNARYATSEGSPVFFLFHRRRVFSASEQAWIGWERKRGKLHELNRHLRGATDTTFVGVAGAGPAQPDGIRFVITLDSDTRLPPETVRRLIGKLGHPLNRPGFDAGAGRVVEGYAVLQPRVTASLPLGAAGSVFQRVFASRPGLDPYLSASSDVYQDLFGEGSYAGKGIYDVDAFEAALAGRVPDGALLSHDLFEGIFARAGLVSDVEVFDDFPARYEQSARRQHRWVRGDWQLLPWILGRRDLEGARATGAAGLPLLGRWKMLDNLRRSLATPALVAALLAAAAVPGAGAALAALLVLATQAIPAGLPVLDGCLRRPAGATLRSRLRAIALDGWSALAQLALGLTLAAHQATVMLDAIGRALYRMAASHRKLLEWVSAAHATDPARPGAGAMYRYMAAGVAVGGVALLVADRSAGPARLVEAGLGGLWLAAPLVAAWASRAPKAPRAQALDAAERRALARVARRTWRFFETFVTVDEHWLPPDNFQEDPLPVIARRTSPTNIGLYLLATVCARRFGWLGTGELVRRLGDSLDTIGRLEHCRGHLYNWYDTTDLRPLEPRYVSSVDSGNLAGHLIAVANACEAWAGALPPRLAFVGGIEAALGLAADAAAALPGSASPFRAALRARLLALDHGGTDGANVELRLAAAAAELPALAAAAEGLPADGRGATDAVYWTLAAARAARAAAEEPPGGGAAEAGTAAALVALAARARRLAYAMDFRFLFDERRRLLSIGYRPGDDSLDPSCYDLLASEARLASFVAIAKGDIASRHWFRLGRAVAPVGSDAALVSWSGSMFEYLMPGLVMRAPVGSVLEHTSRLVVERQISYAAAAMAPWGISESGYNARDIDQTYQYSTFGIPGLGLKRGLRDDLVVAPYATALATMVLPGTALRNFGRLAACGALGTHGYYEALDFTASRRPAGHSFALVRSYMAHHQGMSIVAIANALFDGAARGWFHAEPSIQAIELLLQERAPRDVPVSNRRAGDLLAGLRAAAAGPSAIRTLDTVHSDAPQTQLLSNGRYALMVSAAGAGYSAYGDIALTRWRADATCEDSGSFVFLREVASGFTWSATHQPLGAEADAASVTFAEDRVDFTRSDGVYSTHLEVIVSPEDDLEARRVSVTNTGFRSRDVEVTSYLEPVLAAQVTDLEHPAFAKLFVHTEFLAAEGVLLATRRPRGPAETPVWAAHHAVVEGEQVGALEAETCRATFLGRGRGLRDAAAMEGGAPLGGTVGDVLDAALALRVRLRLPAGATGRVTFWLAAADSRAALLELVGRHREPSAFARASMLSWTQAQVQLRHFGVSAMEAILFQRLAGLVLYPDAALRPSPEVLLRGAGGPGPLWAQGISGTRPIVLLRIDDVDDLAIARQLLRAHEYWRRKGLSVDLVILNDRETSYVEDLHTVLDAAVRTGEARHRAGSDPAQGAVFLLRADRVPSETRLALVAVARIVAYGRRGTLAEQLGRATPGAPAVPRARRAPRRAAALAAPPRAEANGLEFWNGLGGFGAGGREYVIRLAAGAVTPAPWLNVIANPHFGFQVSADGGGYTWAGNSRDHKLTPWSNDPVTDLPGEVIYLRDEAVGEVWCATAAPIRDRDGEYTVRHGHGYSRFEHSSRGIALELVQCVALADPVKLSRLRIRNLSGRTRTLSVTAYLEWVLGTSRAAVGDCVCTAIDAETGAFTARNPWRTAFGPRLAFVDMGGRQTEWTGDRREFLGRYGSVAEPAALLGGAPLSRRVGAGLDPCCALKAPVTLEAGESTDIVIVVGEAAAADAARALVRRYREQDPEALLGDIARHWDGVLGNVQVRTPERALDLMVNGWLLYQTLACRLWARSAFYQSSGAYGFRDQLQDSLALQATQPALAREHLLRAAAQQFREGDVQHWWLPHSGQGVRTRIADDRVWLAYVAAEYVGTTADRAVLDVPVPFLEGRPLAAGEDEAFFEPTRAAETATLYEHCARALDHSLATGAHGLPLIGTGDWNDGMNRVGAGGAGESVWLGWFLHATLDACVPLAAARGDAPRAARWRAHAAGLALALEAAGWDGGWYRRAYFDDGTALGTAAGAECQIDAIAQSWSVLAGAGDPARARQAMRALVERLVRPAEGLALLLAPPFDVALPDPGYIRAYPPGVRENGGQYTHAAAWSCIALAGLGDGDGAAALFALLNPVHHADTASGMQRYRVEPYVVAADIYSVAPHVGRGGWSWYTGASGWLYRAALESILGLRRRGAVLCLAPCLPRAWPRVEVDYRHGTSCYHIVIENPDGVSTGVLALELDGVPLAAGVPGIALVDDGAAHAVRVRLGRDPTGG
jgi:cyclic beta-1,2-glucan synthetase